MTRTEPLFSLGAFSRDNARRATVGGLFGLARQRRDLARLEPRMLDDIGVDPKAARTEAGRPIWDVPAGWRA